MRTKNILVLIVILGLSCGALCDVAKFRPDCVIGKTRGSPRELYNSIVANALDFFNGYSQGILYGDRSMSMRAGVSYVLDVCLLETNLLCGISFD